MAICTAAEDTVDMTRTTERHPLMSSSPGSSRWVTAHRFGSPGDRPKAYFQAALHADETPPLLVAHYLVRRLDEIDAEGGVRGEIIVVPYANPIGLAQTLNGRHLGRHEFGSGTNFNRAWPDLFEPVAERLVDRLTEDSSANVTLIRHALREALAAREPATELDSLRSILAGLAVDSDIVLDLHCDNESLLHLFLSSAHWPGAEDLAAESGIRAVLLTDDSGAASFDEAFSAPWTRLAERYPAFPIPPACLSATLEFRGYPDVDDELARSDAAALVRFLQRRGVVAGDPGPLPRPMYAAARLDAVDVVRSPGGGVVSYTAGLGVHVREGDTIAWLIDPAAEDPADGRTSIHSRTDGFVLTRRQRKFVAPNTVIAKVVGDRSLPHRTGYLAED